MIIARDRIALLGVGLAILTAWMLQHPYLGVAYNDSTLYSVQALARLHPSQLGSDVFLRFGSQDDYTLFSPLYAQAIRWFDLEPAAAMLTLVFQMTFFGAAWLFARQVMPTRHAVLALGLLAALPSSYGIENFFSYVESFLTPRQIAEALVLASIACLLAGRNVAAALCLLAGFAMHPIMAFAGVVFIFCLKVALPRPRLSAALVTAALLGAWAVTATARSGRFAAFDPTWLGLIRDYSPYLFVSTWSLENWGRIVVPGAVLIAGALGSASAAVRQLCAAALLTALASLLVAIVCCDRLNGIIFIQMQPWRWLWLSEVTAVVLLPVITEDCLARGPSGRATVILLIGAWLLRDYIFSLGVSVAAIVCAAVPPATLSHRSGRLLLAGSLGTLALSAIIVAATRSSYVPLDTIPANSMIAELVAVARRWGEDGVAYSLSIAASWWILTRRNTMSSALSLLLVCGVLCAVTVTQVSKTWTSYVYTARLKAAFAPWREAIPTGTEVIWPGTPMGAWYVLERPSYYSIHQVAGDIFSRDKALEIHRRALLIQRGLHADTVESRHDPRRQGLDLPRNADNLGRHGLALVCQDPQLGFVASWSPLGDSPFLAIAPNVARPERRLRLYRCADLRG